MAAGIVMPALHSQPLNPPRAPSMVNVRMPAKRAWTVRMTGPLALETNRRAAERSDHKSNDVRDGHAEASLIRRRALDQH